MLLLLYSSSPSSSSSFASLFTFFFCFYSSISQTYFDQCRIFPVCAPKQHLYKKIVNVFYLVSAVVIINLKCEMIRRSPMNDNELLLGVVYFSPVDGNVRSHAAAQNAWHVKQKFPKLFGGLWFIWKYFSCKQHFVLFSPACLQ